MSSLHLTLLDLRLNTPAVFILLVTVPYLILFFITARNMDSTGGKYSLFWTVCCAAEACMLNTARSDPSLFGFIWRFAVILLASSAILAASENLFASKVKSERKALLKALEENDDAAFFRILDAGDESILSDLKDPELQKKALILKALKEDDAAALFRTIDSSNAGVLLDLKDPDLRKKAVRFSGRYRLSPDVHHILGALPDREEAREIIRDTACVMSCRLELYSRYPELADYSNPDWLIEQASKNPGTADALRNHLEEITDPVKLEEAIEATKALEHPDVIEQITPNLSYPENAGSLRKIVCDLKLDRSVRSQAYSLIPESDEAYEKRYCPYCGSDRIRSGYMRLAADMYWYGFRCEGCGHESSLPEGMGKADPFDVSFADLMR